jgi:hypothetical protein
MRRVVLPSEKTRCSASPNAVDAITSSRSERARCFMTRMRSPRTWASSSSKGAPGASSAASMSASVIVGL